MGVNRNSPKYTEKLILWKESEATKVENGKLCLIESIHEN